ncbi:hypothetical protein BEL04_03930 [Mucilaginibacter sp. PPCGB 2223]|uniref:hypothetical protein n=1 Tax=Mucilaginibacter sp. PPCGB 2223 TaxID=1886027 RepID=UPI000826DF18|nr:hypothetical protein [Mucilaginibacter sp. PPCGB 2223]OCX53460.1 hypothetical protein BEL04_03930 [Mucilaginibacter sp. PPCGB 2223]
MSFRLIFTFILLLISAQLCLAQETIELSTYHGGGITEKYNTLKSDRKIKQGLYQQITRKNTAIVSGVYDHNKRVGIWHFYDKDGHVNELYNYTTQKLLYEAPVDSTHDYIEYIFDKKTTRKDTVTKPVRIGGTWFGYLPYIKLFKVDPLNFYGSVTIRAFLQILVSPGGRLSECKLIVQLKNNNAILDTYLLNNDLLDEYDKQFVAATINRQPVVSTISILVKINPDWSISLY